MLVRELRAHSHLDLLPFHFRRIQKDKNGARYETRCGLSGRFYTCSGHLSKESSRLQPYLTNTGSEEEHKGASLLSLFARLTTPATPCSVVQTGKKVDRNEAHEQNRTSQSQQEDFLASVDIFKPEASDMNEKEVDGVSARRAETDLVGLHKVSRSFEKFLEKFLGEA